MPLSNQNSLTLIFVAVAVLAGGTGLWLARSLQNDDVATYNQEELRDGPLLKLPEPKVVADFSLYDDEGVAFSRADIEGQWTLVFFGFSSCPHICPDTLFRLVQVRDGLRDVLPPDRVPKVLFIGVDPERDTPAALSAYRDRFDGNIMAVSGSDAQLRALAMQLGVHYVVPEHEEGKWYSVDHSINVLLLDTNAKWVGVFSAPHDVDSMAGALSRYLGESK
jgi:protein SCO1/2